MEAVSIGAIALLGLALRIARLPYIAVWSDEYHSIRVSALPLGDIIAGRYVEFNPPLYFAILHMWRVWLGDGELALRAPSLLFAALSFALFLVLTRELLGSGMPLIAAAVLFAFHPMLIYFAVEIRAYALLVLMSLVAMLSLVRVLDDARDSVAWVAGLALGVAGSLYTHYFGFTVVLAVAGFFGVSVLRKGWRGAHHGRALAAIGAGIISWLPVIGLLRSQLERYPWGAADRIPPQRFLNLAQFGAVHPPYEAFLVAFSAFALLGGLLVLATGTARRLAGLGLVASLAAAAGGAVVAHLCGVNVAPRSMIALVPMAGIGVSGILADVPSRWVQWATRLLGGMTLILFVAYGTGFTLAAPDELALAEGRADWRRIASALALIRRPGEGILLSSYDASPLSYYMHEDLPQVWDVDEGAQGRERSRLIVMTQFSAPLSAGEQGQLVYEDPVEGIRVIRLDAEPAHLD